MRGHERGAWRRKVGRLWLAGALCVFAAARPAATADLAPRLGTYKREATKDMGSGVLHLWRAPEGQWRVEVVAGGHVEDDWGPADCTVVVVGRLKGGRLVGHPVPFSSEDSSPSEEDIMTHPNAKVVIVFKGDHAKIVWSSAEWYCGIGSDIQGDYRFKSRKILPH